MIINIRYYSIILLIIIIKNCAGHISEYVSEATFSCYSENFETTYNSKENPNYVIHEPNKEEGTVNFEFDFKSYRIYELKLWYENNYKRKVHSNYLYNVTKDLDNNINTTYCGKSGIITLKYIFSGCYFIFFNHYGNPLFIKSVCWNTDYKKKTYPDYLKNNTWPIITYRNFDTIFEMEHPFLKLQPQIRFILMCNNCISLYPEFAVEFQMEQDSSNPDKYVDFDNSSPLKINVSISCQIERTKGSLLCYIEGLDNGNYSIIITLNNLIQCANIGSNIWPRCSSQASKMRLILNDEPITDSSTKDIINKNTIYWIILGAMCTFIALTAIIIYRLKHPPLSTPVLPVASTDADIALIEAKKVLLLYPRDAQVVMETIEALRNALIAKGFQVYDVYDPKREKKISENPEKWIFDLLSNKTVKIVIIPTYCGQILSQHLNLAFTLYRNPIWSDFLFSYAISLLRDKAHLNNQRRVFIANIGFDQMNYSIFDFLVPSTTYSLPECFKQLSRDLFNNKTFNDSDFDEQSSEDTFSQLHKEMTVFIKNCFYLSEILNVEVTKFDNEIEIHILKK